MKKLKTYNQETAAAKSGMTVKTARKYIKSGKPPSETSAPSRESTRSGPFSDIWPELVKMLGNAPGLQARTLLNYLITQHPGKYQPGQLRTLQRRVQAFRAEHGVSKAVIFRQNIKPGKQSQSDHTCMNGLNITIAGEAFKHLLFHFMLPYSRWESINVCFSESFESLAAGFEKAVWELGYCVAEHRTDNLSAATKAMGSKREFTDRWQALMSHYGITPTTNNLGVSHENGAVEKSHDTLKTAIDQALLLRGDRNFDTQSDYSQFVEAVVKTRNDYCLDSLALEVPHLRELPDKQWHAPTIVHARVSTSSIIHLCEVPYTVPSRLIHYTLKAYIYPDEIHLFYGNKPLQRMPRVNKSSLAGINYRHLIDSLLRKPAAFANYRYVEALFPRQCFKQAYERLRASRPANADKDYLTLLQLAKMLSEQSVAEALELLIEENHTPTPKAVKELIDAYQQERVKVTVDAPVLQAYDDLLTTQEAH